MKDGAMTGQFLSSMPNVIMKAMMMYDFKGIMSHTFRFPASIRLMRSTFLNSILTNIAENRSIVVTLPMTISAEVASRFIHVVTPILQTLKPAISQMRPAMKVRDFVFIRFGSCLMETGWFPFRRACKVTKSNRMCNWV